VDLPGVKKATAEAIVLVLMMQTIVRDDEELSR